MVQTVFKRIFWTVPNSSKEWIESCEVEKIVESRTISVKAGDNSMKWTLMFYPNNKCEESKSHLGLYLRLDKSDSKNFRIYYKFGIKGKNENDCEIRANYSDKGGDFKERCGKGSEKLISWKDLFESADRLIVNGTITLICEFFINLIQEPDIFESALSKVFISNYRKIFDDDFLADFELKTNDGDVLKAHKVILASQSKVFRAMFENESKEAKEGVVEIPDIDPDAMIEALRFMYYGEVESLEDIAEDLIFAAEKYELDELKKICINSLIKTLTLENVLKILLVSYRISQAEHLFETCSNLIIFNYKTISKKKEWEDLPTKCIMKVMDEMKKRFDKVCKIQI